MGLQACHHAEGVLRTPVWMAGSMSSAFVHRAARLFRFASRSSPAVPMKFTHRFPGRASKAAARRVRKVIANSDRTTVPQRGPAVSRIPESYGVSGG